MTHSDPSRTPTPEEAAALVREATADGYADTAPDTVDQHDAAEPIHMPSPSVWPITAAFGVTMISFGVLTGWAFGIFGGAMLAIGLWGWVHEMRSDAA